MKKIKFIFALSGILYFNAASALTWNQHFSNGDLSSNWEKGLKSFETEKIPENPATQSESIGPIEQAVLDLKQAILSAKEEALRSISSTHLSYGHSNGLVENQDAFVANLVSGKSVFLSIDISDQTIDQRGKTAMVRHTFYAKTKNNGELGEVRLKVLMIFQKENGSWKLWARQAVKIPL